VSRRISWLDYLGVLKSWPKNVPCIDTTKQRDGNKFISYCLTFLFAAVVAIQSRSLCLPSTE
jgi:hypothetical protein